MGKSFKFKPGQTKPFGLSRSKLNDFLTCPRCFYLDRRLGIKKPQGPPFTLNSAVDKLLKKEFDRYRLEGRPHPYIEEAGLDLIPFRHPDMDKWRENFVGIRHVHEASGFELSGAIDDLWQCPKTGQLVVADYKATAKAAEVNLDSAWQVAYKRQMEFYQWLLQRNGFDVSATGYFVYCNGDAGADAFGGVLRFVVKLLPYTGDHSWVEPALLEARRCLESDEIPSSGSACEQCAYLMDAAQCLRSLC